MTGGVPEKWAVSAILAYPDVLKGSGLRPGSFNDSELRRWIRSAAEVQGLEGPAYLRETASRAEIFPGVLAQIQEECPVGSEEHAREKVRDLVEETAKRKLQKELNDILVRSRGRLRTAEIVSELSDLAEAHRAVGGREEGSRTLSELMEAAAAKRRREIEEGVTPYIPTGFRPFDIWTRGLRTGDFQMLSGRPGAGKTTVALAIMKNAAAAGHASLLVSCEESGARLGEKSLHSALGQPMSRHLTLEDLARWEGSREAKKVWVVTPSAPSLEQLKRSILWHRDQHGVVLVVVDHQNKIYVREKGSFETLMARAQGLKALAKETKVAIVALSHFNINARLGKGNDDEPAKPSLDMIPGGDAVSGEADAVTAVWRPAKSKLTELHVLKNRVTGILDMVQYWFGQDQGFEEAKETR